MFFWFFWNILVLSFSVFGAYCAIKTLSETLFSSDCISVALEVREPQEIEDMDMLLREAQSLSIRRGRARLVVLISYDLMDGTLGEGEELYDDYMALLDRYGAECYLIDL